jgi:hypothetical protein
MKSRILAEKVKRKLGYFKINSKDELTSEKESQESGNLEIDLMFKIDMSESFDELVKDITNDGKRSGSSEEEIEDEILSRFNDGDFANYILEENIASKVYKEFKYSEEVDLGLGQISTSFFNMDFKSVKTVEEAREKVKNVKLEVSVSFPYSLSYELIDKIKKELTKNFLKK